MVAYPCINMKATGARINELRRKRNLTVLEVSAYMGFENPQAVYHWQSGKALPSLDNMFALSVLFEVSINDILVSYEEADEASSFIILNYKFNDKSVSSRYCYCNDDGRGE